MKIILLGNGFDLAHGLPTTYTNFLDFMKKIDPSYNKKYNISLNPEIERLINDPSKEISINKIKQLCADNIWLTYFYERNYLYPNWCDFESEIEYITKNLEAIKKELETMREAYSSKFHSYPSFNFLKLSIKNFFLSYICKTDLPKYNHIHFLRDRIPDYANLTLGNNTFDIDKMINNYRSTSSFDSNTDVPFELLVDFILQQLNSFTKCFELYLSNFITELNVQKISFISNLVDSFSLKILNFNYTNTIAIYKQLGSLNICYIHGKACNDDNNNLVLGINETENNIDPMFTRFRKYFQRFEKNCKYNYRDWIKDIKHNIISDPLPLGSTKHNLYIIGHSLTLNDKNILNELITLPETTTTIYYHSDNSKLSMMQNLAAILGSQKFTEYMEANAVKFVRAEFDKKLR